MLTYLEKTGKNDNGGCAGQTPHNLRCLLFFTNIMTVSCYNRRHFVLNALSPQMRPIKTYVKNN